jgi:hypothetical protein
VAGGISSSQSPVFPALPEFPQLQPKKRFVGVMFQMNGGMGPDF